MAKEPRSSTRRAEKPSPHPADPALAENQDQADQDGDKPDRDEADRKEFTLTAEESTKFALLVREGADLSGFWAQAAEDYGIDPDSVVLISSDSPVRFSAFTGCGEWLDEQAGQHEARFNAGLTAMDGALANMRLESATLVGDLRDSLLEIVKHLQKPWPAHSQFEKRDLAAKLEYIARETVAAAVDVVAGSGRITVKAVVDKIAIGEKVQITLKLGTMNEDDTAAAIQQLYHCQKKQVLIVTADPGRHDGQRRDPVEPDQDDLPFEAGNDADLAAGADDPAEAAEPEEGDAGDDQDDGVALD